MERAEEKVEMNAPRVERHERHPLAERAGRAVGLAEDRARGFQERLGRAMERPMTGAMIAGGAVLAAAVMWGAAEAAVAAAAGYAAYRVIRRARGLEPPREDRA